MKTFNCTNCGECCGPIAVNKWELKRIKNAIKRMPQKEVKRLKNQIRNPLTCMFRDIENNCCAIYQHRPEICKMFGHYKGLVCPENPEFAVKTNGEEQLLKQSPVGVLTLEINWNNIHSFVGNK